MAYRSSYSNPDPYVPATLSEIYDLLGSMILGAPTFIDRTGYFAERNLESEFHILISSFDRVRPKLAEDRYTALLDLAGRAKSLFAEDQDDKNGKTDEGRALLFEIEDIIQAARSRRVKAKLPDDEGEVTGD